MTEWDGGIRPRCTAVERRGGTDQVRGLDVRYKNVFHFKSSVEKEVQINESSYKRYRLQMCDKIKRKLDKVKVQMPSS